MNGLLEQRGVVRRIADGRALVALESSACGGCAHAGGCGAGRLAAAAAPRLVTLPAEASLRVGDAVLLSQPERRIVLSALLGYLFPALALLVGAWFGATLAGSDAGAAFGAASGFLAALAISRLLLAVLPGVLPPPRAIPLSRPSTLSPQEYSDEP
ncbi:MAG: SoxR reducing system RseC family protein [Rhodocyclales bacterium]|nr:SoxR reducing system RseC family protein [Rhodocyclales bacterium]